jgi:hypothetical protein
VEKDAVEMPPTQIGRALRELGINWIGAHSPQAKGRVERNFRTAQDRLVRGMRVAGVKTIEQANQYLQDDYRAWWDQELTVEPANADDAHRTLDKSHNLAASLSHVETRQVRNDYTVQWDGEFYQIELRAVVSGLRRANVRVEQRLDGTLAVRYGEKYLPVTRCEMAAKKAPAPASAEPTGKRRQPRRGGPESEFRFKEIAEDLASGAGIRSPAWRGVKWPLAWLRFSRKWREGKVRPSPETLRTTGW